MDNFIKPAYHIIDGSCKRCKCYKFVPVTYYGIKLVESFNCTYCDNLIMNIIHSGMDVKKSNKCILCKSYYSYYHFEDNNCNLSVNQKKILEKYCINCYFNSNESFGDKINHMYSVHDCM